MIVSCDQCRARFRVDESKIGPKGARLRCAKCGHVFKVTGDVPSPPPQEAQDPKSLPIKKTEPVAQATPEEASKAPVEKQAELLDWFSDLTEKIDESIPAEAPSPPPPTPAVSKSAETPADESGTETASLMDASLPTPSSSELSPTPTLPATSPDSQGLPPPMAEADFPSFPDDDPMSATTDTPEKTPLATVALNRVAVPKQKDELFPEESSVKSTPSRVRPLVAGLVTRNQQISHVLAIGFITLIGIALGLSAMGVKLTPRALSFLWLHGIPEPESGIHLLHYHGDLIPVNASERVFVVNGEILNKSLETRTAIPLRLEIFSPQGEYIAKTDGFCCDKGILPGATAPFQMRVQFGRTLVGSYKVTVKKLDGVSSNNR